MPKQGFKLKNSPPAADGTWESEVLYEEDFSDCNDVADQLQSDCNDIADDLQPSCNDVADMLPSTCGDPADKPQKPLRTPIAPLNSALVDFLADDKKFKKLVYNYFDSVENLAETQKTAPKYLTSNLNDLGFKVNADDLTRNYLPAARVKRERRKTELWKKTSYVLAALLVVVFCALPHSRKEHKMSRVEVEQNGDSALYWNDMVKFIVAYNSESSDKIYPFSYPIVYNRINEKNISDVQGIKEVLDNRIAEIKDSKKN